MSVHDETWDKCSFCGKTNKTWHGDYHDRGYCMLYTTWDDYNYSYKGMITEEKIDTEEEQILMEQIQNKKYTYEETAQYLHYHADKFDKEVIKDLVDKKLSSAYDTADLAKSLRIAANFIDGVQGT